MFKKIFLITLCIFSLILFVSCKRENEKTNDNTDQETKDEIISVKLKDNTVKTYDTFTLDNIYLTVTYSESGTKDVLVTPSMVKTYLNSLKKGENSIEIDYEGFIVTLKIVIEDSFEKLLATYNLVVVLESTENKTFLSFYSGFDSLGVEFSLNNSVDYQKLEKLSPNIISKIEKQSDLDDIFYVNTDNSKKMDDVLTISGTNLGENLIEIKASYALIGDDIEPIAKEMIYILYK